MSGHTEVLLRCNSGAFKARLNALSRRCPGARLYCTSNAFAIVVTLLLFAFFFYPKKITFHSQTRRVSRQLNGIVVEADGTKEKKRKRKKQLKIFAFRCNASCMQRGCLCVYMHATNIHCAWVSVRIYACH